MSFLSVLSKIGGIFNKTVAVVQPLEPVIAAVPGGAIFDTVLNSIVTVEGLVTTAKAGAAKKSAVTTIVNAQTPGVNQTALASAIDQIVAALNAVQAASTTLTPPTLAQAANANTAAG